MTVTATVDLARLPGATGKGTVWHVVSIPDRDVTLCRVALAEGCVREDGLDAHVISFRGKSVCQRCRRALS